MAFIVSFKSDYGTTTVIAGHDKKCKALRQAWERMYSIYGQQPEKDIEALEKIQTMKVDELKSFKLWGSRSPVERTKNNNFQSPFSFCYYPHWLNELAEISAEEYQVMLRHQEILKLIPA